MGNPVWRLETTLNYTAQVVHELGRDSDVEIVVTDWGSDTPLQSALDLHPTAAKMVSFVVVPPDLAKMLQRDSPFSEAHALNAAARRADGQYVGRIDQDTLVGKRFLRAFFEVLEGKRSWHVPLESAIWFANRRGIPYRFTQTCAALPFVDRFVQLFGHVMDVTTRVDGIQSQQVYWTNYVGILLMHRDLWYACEGYNEEFIYMNGLEPEMIMRLFQQHEIVDLGRLVDFDFYHLDHYAGNVKKGDFSAHRHRKVNDFRNFHSWPKVLRPNGPDWGMLQYPLLKQTNLTTAMRSKEVPIGSNVWGTLGFTYTISVCGAAMLWNKVLYVFRRMSADLSQALLTGSHRMRVAWETTRGRPPGRWPRLLRERWKEGNPSKSRLSARPGVSVKSRTRESLVAYTPDPKSSLFLCRLIAGSQLKWARQVLDVGVENGAMSLLAFKAGAGTVLALDSDSEAIAAAEMNVSAAGMQHSFETRLMPAMSADPFAVIEKDEQFDLIISNLTWLPLHAPADVALSTAGDQTTPILERFISSLAPHLKRDGRAWLQLSDETHLITIKEWARHNDHELTVVEAIDASNAILQLRARA